MQKKSKKGIVLSAVLYLLMLILTVPVAILGMKIAEKTIKKQSSALK